MCLGVLSFVCLLRIFVVVFLWLAKLLVFWVVCFVGLRFVCVDYLLGWLLACGSLERVLGLLLWFGMLFGLFIDFDILIWVLCWVLCSAIFCLLFGLLCFFLYFVFAGLNVWRNDLIDGLVSWVWRVLLIGFCVGLVFFAVEIGLFILFLRVCICIVVCVFCSMFVVCGFLLFCLFSCDRFGVW